MRRLALLALTTLGCNQVFGLAPLDRADGAPTDGPPTDGDGPDTASTCGAPTGTRPGGARTMSADGLVLEPQGAGQVGSNRAIIGVASATAVLDGLVIRRAGATANDAWRIGGVGGDLLVGAADDGATLLAVGASRTGVLLGEPDRGLVTFVPTTGEPVAHQLSAASDALTGTAATAIAGGWVVAGRLRGTAVAPLTAAAWVGVLAADGTVRDAVGLSLDAQDDLRPRAVVGDATRVFVVGSRTDTSGLVFAYAPDDGAVPWATTLPFPAVGAALHGGQLLVGGPSGPDGLLATLDPTTGVVASIQRLPDARLHRLTSVGAELWVAGPATGGVFVGQLTDGCVAATLHTGFAVPSRYQAPQPLVPNATGAIVYSATTSGAIAERTIDRAGSSTCAVAGFGRAGVATTLTGVTVGAPITERVDVTRTPFTSIAPLAITTVTACL